MSRSKHQQHKFFHNKRQPHPFRNRKIKPYGLKGWREGGTSTFRTLFLKYSQGIQILMHWLWFEILIENKNKHIYYEGKSRIS